MSGIVGSKLNHRGSGVVAKLGTDGQHLLSSGKGVTANYETVTAATYDDTDIRRDIITLALKEGITENRVAYNLPNAHVQQFQDDTGIGAETTGDRNSDEYWSPTTSSTLTPDGDDWEGNTGSYTLTSGGANCTTGDNAMTITTDFSGDVTATFDVDGGAANSQGYGFYETSEVGSYLDTDRAGMQNMTNSWWQHGGYNQDTYYGGSVVKDNSSIPADGSTVILQRSGGVWLWKDDGTTIHTWTQTSTATVTFAICNDGTGGTPGNIQSLSFVYSTINATGTLDSSAQTANSARTKVGGIIIYKNAAGTATLGTDIRVYFTCNGGTNWTESTLTAAGTFSSGILMAKCAEATCTSGTDIRYRVVWANQSASKDTQLHGVGMNY